MRPRGEVRAALAAAAQQMAEPGGGVTWLELARALPGVNPGSPAELKLVRRTVENMARAGELVNVGSHKPPGSTRWMALYELAMTQDLARDCAAAVIERAAIVDAATHARALDALNDATRGWGSL